jgi:hypothetical protein
VAGRGREASARIARQLRDAFAALLDQRTPFGRLALTHVVLTAGDTLVTVSLAGSLFFKNISTSEARSNVVLFLLLTSAPFAVVAPFLGPILDRSRGARRAIVVLSAACRAAMALVMVKGLSNLLVFPEAFTMLVLSKAYLITKGSLVPMVVGSETRAGAGSADSGDELAVANARLGLLASLAGFAASLPAIAVLKLLNAGWVLRLDFLVFVVGAVLAFRLPIARTAQGTWDRVAAPAQSSPAPGSVPPATRVTWNEETPLGALGPRVNTHPEVILALSAMSILKGLMGFVTFLLAFALKGSHTHHNPVWYGFMLAATVAGTLVGVMLVPRARKLLTEPQLIAVSIWAVALAGGLAALVGDIVIQALVAFVIGVAGSAAKPAFDALVQRYVPPAAQGRAFARFETRLQLVWVLGALLPVVVTLPLGAGDIVIAAAAAVSGVSYLTSRRALRHRWVAP